MYFQHNCKLTKQKVKNNFPDAFNIKLGDNNLCKGYWFNLPTHKFRCFTPLIEMVHT
jgi:hypothetical protein|nr:MAG TPA: hypothetical protein [Caudoviricetes sp.]